jgi:hypothetical protein
MVDMGVREQDSADGFRIEAEFAILTSRLFSPALKHTAIQQQTQAWHFKEMPTAGDGSSGSVKREVHRVETPWWRAIVSQAS